MSRLDELLKRHQGIKNPPLAQDELEELQRLQYKVDKKRAGVVKEKDFQRQIEDLAHTLGWTIAHFRTARTISGWMTAVSGDGVGFPDCVLVRRDRLIFAELKSEKGKLSESQEGWLDALIEVAKSTNHQEIQVYVWKPHMFDEICGILK